MNIQKKNADVSHAVLIIKIDDENFYLKNSYKDEPIIIIPKNRSTVTQRYLSTDGPKDFKVKPKEIREKMNQSATFKPIHFFVGKEDWMINDDGFKLRMKTVP